MLIYKDDINLSLGVAYKKNVDKLIANKLPVDDVVFWQSVKDDAKQLLHCSAEIMNELRVEREGK